MPIIEIEKHLITQVEIGQCVELFRGILQDEKIEKKIHLKASNTIDGFDLLLVAYFIMFSTQVPELENVIELPFNPISSNEQLEYQLKQAGTYGYLMTKRSVFTVIFGDGVNATPINFDLKTTRSFPDRWFVFSKDFFPFLVITDNYERIDTYFEKGLNEQSQTMLNKLHKDVKWVKDIGELRNACVKQLRESAVPTDRKGSLVTLATIAFYNALDEARILNFFFENEYKLSDFDNTNRIYAGNLINKKAFEYYHAVKPIFNELAEKSLIYQFLFSTILSTDALVDKTSGKDILNEATSENFVSKLYQLWNFTKDLVVSLRELAKNIYEHARPQIGVISLRIFERSKWVDLQQYDYRNAHVYGHYTDHLQTLDGRKNFALMEINVIDIGRSGILSTLFENTKALEAKADEKSNLKKILQEDQYLLERGEIRLKNLLQITGMQLNQQSKRNIAHFGLLTFAKLIEVNDGLIIASTYQIGNTEREAVVLPENYNGDLQATTIGTNYRIILPVRRSEVYKTHLPHRITLPTEISAKDIKGMETLLNYEIIKLGKNRVMPILEDSMKYILTVKVKTQVLKTRQDEQLLWHELQDLLSPVLLLTETSRSLVCLNLGNIRINESQLFRLLGNWQVYYPSFTLAITNIENDVYQKLIALNGDFNKLNPLVDYWNAGIATIVYNFISIGNERFYFTDVLWGKTREEFINLNWIVNLTNFNSTVLLNKQRMKAEVIKNSQPIYTHTDVAFYNRNTLLPFDLLFEGAATTTLFEHNAVILLQNEIKY
jgi:hypothetical protein